MAMPNNLVLVRHGQSEANVVQKLFKTDRQAVAPEGFHERHDSHMVLSPEGVEQAKAAGRWLLEHFPNGFYRYYTSDHARARHTAATLAINGRWRRDDRWRERDWGEFGNLNEEDRQRLYERSVRMKQLNPWYWVPPGGESLSTGVRLRFEDILDTFHREVAGQDVIAVTHGETIDVARFVLERMTVDEWLANDRDPAQKIHNCQILHYTRQDPVTGEIARQLGWFRSVCPWNPESSWQGGEWMAITPRREYSDSELLESISAYPPLLPADS